MGGYPIGVSPAVAYVYGEVSGYYNYGVPDGWVRTSAIVEGREGVHIHALSGWRA